MIYSDPIIAKYIALIQANTDAYRQFYQGDPIRLPQTMLPCCIISKIETRIAPVTNAEDRHEMQLTLTVVTDMRAEIRNEKDIAPGTARLYELIEGRDATTLQLKADAILAILRGNLLVDATLGLRTDLETITQAEYGLTVGKRAEGQWAVEASVSWISHFIQVR
jgi:hypothetical protein